MSVNKRLKSGWILFIWVVLLYVYNARGVVFAQEATPSDDAVNRISRQLYCPVCDNIPLDACATQACEQWRELIRQRLSEGWTEQEIKEYFVAQYGERVLGEPPRRGFNWLLYFLPPVIIAYGLLWIIFRLQGSAPEGSSHEERQPDPYRQQVEQDLKNLESS